MIQSTRWADFHHEWCGSFPQHEYLGLVAGNTPHLLGMIRLDKV